jgi:argininosuccinate synthase
MASKFGSYGEMNEGYTGDDVKGFSKIFGNQVKIYHSVNASQPPEGGDKEPSYG